IWHSNGCAMDMTLLVQHCPKCIQYDALFVTVNTTPSKTHSAKICLRISAGHGNFGASALRKDTAQVEPPTDDLANTTAGRHKGRATQATNGSPQRTRPQANGGPTPAES
ncbi:hypothetical protein, partial [Acidovorax sp. IB03]|uniref:hypothetical protein n=1 Tax=Acidovorax sp. IB03 TaxID=2779366 RepID=UPI001E421289